MDRVAFVSADSHAIAPLETIRGYIDSRYARWFDELQRESARFKPLAAKFSTPSDEELEVIDGRRAIRSGGYLGTWDVNRRLLEMDDEGVAAEILFPGVHLESSPFFGCANNPYPADVRWAGARAYHRWVSDFMSEADGRLFGVGNPGPCSDMDSTVQEIRWLAGHGFRSISVPGVVADPALPPLTSHYFEPFWRACADHGLVLSVHASHGATQGLSLRWLENLAFSRTHEQMVDDSASGIDGSPFEHDSIPATVMWSLMVAGVFDRYPNLQLALTEVRADWVPAMLKVMDELYAAGGTPMRKQPTEYWRSNCWAGVSSIKPSEVRLRYEIGLDRMMFGRDYPHIEGTWPNTFDWLRDSIGDFSEDEARMLLGENAIRCYGLDRDKVNGIAERIGPQPSDFLGEHTIAPGIQANLRLRGGAKKTYEHIDRLQATRLLEDVLSGSETPNKGSQKRIPMGE